ncbi:DUF2490 domain-containing protein [Polaribacter pectinis]|uniref:DUF2490 domain-containing protein n=1 Tax=Polaribacter pectinis TaxID=2738844 RepID=A0A7G9L704_9FLAO|nr:DUF2490 domain-containing protein [Polaribacter pectinis]QNM84403.1 DUF2490 domain-containing protein [Polaribacter pectinis]
MQIKLLLPTLLLYTVYSFSQHPTESTTKLEETGIWLGSYFKVRLNDKLGYYSEHHYRERNALNNVNSFIGRTRQIYNRFGLNIFVNENFEIVVGPTLVFNFSPEPGNINFEKYTVEPRIWHQWIIKSPKIGRVKFIHQFRFEHRWKRSNVVDAEHDYTNRYRYKIFSYIPLNKDVIEPKTLFFSPSAEIFMQSGSSIVRNPMEDFRTYNGFGYVVNKSITLFAGHMWTIGQKSSGYEYKTSHVFRFNIYIGIDARKMADKLPKINLGY